MRKTKEQKSLNSYHRRLNLKDAFRIVDPAKIKGRKVLIIDDISTTGSTLTELTSLLLKSGAEEVYCAACCHTPAPGTEM
jgi:predicted amidophosphoribosyltransferase